jgi:outer membrane lipoprotein-sorting protein
MTILMTVLLLLAPQEPGLTEVVDGVVRTYSKMNDFSARFEEITKDISNQRHTYRGLLYLKSGRKMLFDQQTPDRKLLYSDGKLSTEYVPGIQAVQTPLGKSDDERLQLFQIPWNPEWKNQFQQFAKLPDRPVTPGNHVIRATPRKKELPVILLEVNPKTFLIERFVTTHPDGGTTEFRFTEMKTARLDPSMFEFKAPPGLEVIKNK